jgi:hypothetical protein
MHKVVRLMIILAVIALSLASAAPVLADPPQGKVGAVVEPVIGGPNNAHTHWTPATVVIPTNNPAIRWDPADILPGEVFVPEAGVGG